MINADNLPWIIYNLKNRNPDKFELLKDVFFQLFPDIEDVIVKNLKSMQQKTISSRMMRHLYLQILSMCYLSKIKI